jgi:SAM-dependent methyltransferase
MIKGYFRELQRFFALFFIRPVLLVCGAVVSSVYNVLFAWWLDDWTFKGRQTRFERDIQKEYSWVFKKYNARIIPAKRYRQVLDYVEGITNIEFREASAESLPFADESYDVLTCRFGAMFFPDLAKALRECLRVLKSGGRAAFVAWGKKEQPFFSTTAGILMKHVPEPPPPPDPEGPSLSMFGERDRLRHALEAAGFASVHEEARIVNGHWAGTPEEYWEQFSEVAAPFRPLIAQLTPERKTAAVAEILATLKKFWNGRELNMPLEIGTGMRP